MKNAEDEYVSQLNNIEEPEIQEEQGKENQPAIANDGQVAKTVICVYEFTCIQAI